MAVIRQGELFNWKDVEVASDLERLRLVIDAVSQVHEELMQELEGARGKGQNKFPVRFSNTSLKRAMDTIPTSR